MEKKERKKELQCSYHKKLTIAISPVFEFHTELFTYLYKLISKFFRILYASLMAQQVKNPPAMQETHMRHGFDPWVGKIPS